MLFVQGLQSQLILPLQKTTWFFKVVFSTINSRSLNPKQGHLIASKGSLWRSWNVIHIINSNQTFSSIFGPKTWTTSGCCFTSPLFQILSPLSDAHIFPRPNSYVFPNVFSTYQPDISFILQRFFPICYTFSMGFPHLFHSFPCVFLMFFPRFPHVFPTFSHVFPRFSHVSPTFFPRFSHVFPVSDVFARGGMTFDQHTADQLAMEAAEAMQEAIFGGLPCDLPWKSWKAVGSSHNYNYNYHYYRYLQLYTYHY